MLDNYPVEMKILPQWVCARANKIPLNPLSGNAADVTDPKTWGTFEQAVGFALKYKTYVGFVLTKESGIVCIDLDDPSKIADPAERQQRIEIYNKIIGAVPGFAEISLSGKGSHLFFLGKLDKNFKRDGIEIYSHARYILCTGNIWRPGPLQSGQSFLDRIEAAGRPIQGRKESQPEAEDDSSIMDRLRRDKTDSRFFDLLEGRWEGHYPSQSEADEGMLGKFLHYTKNHEQLMRLFRETKLNRPKATDVYLERTIQHARRNEPPSVDISSALPSRQLPQQLTDQQQEDFEIAPEEPEHQDQPLPEIPPGLLKYVADFVTHAGYKLMPEAGLAAAIVFLAGIAGRQYNINGTGLNQYLLLLARTGEGKEAAADGLDLLAAAVAVKAPTIHSFRGPARFGSGQGLLRVLSECPLPSIYSVLGEVGLTFRAMFEKHPSAGDTALLQMLLDLYMKSGQGRIFGSAAYSDSQKNTKTMVSPAFSILGESSPAVFYNALNEVSMSGGFIPRFLLLERNAPTEKNPQRITLPWPSLIQGIQDLLSYVFALETKKMVIEIKVDPEAKVLLDAYENNLMSVTRKLEEGVLREVCSRAHLKAFRLAGLAAVSACIHSPVVRPEHVLWACAVVQRGVDTLKRKAKEGDVGSAEDMQQSNAIMDAAAHWKMCTPVQRSRHNSPKGLHKQNDVVPLAFLVHVARRRRCFAMAPGGAHRAFTTCLDALVQEDRLERVNVKIDSRNVVCFRITA